MNGSEVCGSRQEPVDITLDDGRSFTFAVDTGLTGPAFFFLSIRKCGSSFFNDIGYALAQANGRNFVDLSDPFFYGNVSELQWVAEPAIRDIIRPGNAYGGFRMVPSALLETELFQSSPKLLFVRDLRDALVSLYFSNAYSHPIPRAGEEGGEVTELMLRLREEARAQQIDATVVRYAKAMLRTAMEYEAIVHSPSLTILRYEEFIFDKSALIDVIADRFGWRVEDRVRSEILGWADVRPVREDPTLFIRRVTPGDHLEKLQPETIERLNELLRPALELFGYETRP